MEWHVHHGKHSGKRRYSRGQHQCDGEQQLRYIRAYYAIGGAGCCSIGYRTYRRAHCTLCNIQRHLHHFFGARCYFLHLDASKRMERQQLVLQHCGNSRQRRRKHFGGGVERVWK